MSFKIELIQKIKKGIHKDVYDFWDTNSAQFDQDSVKTFIAFLSTDKNTDLIKHYFTQAMVKESDWTYDIQTYVLIIRLYCMIGEYTKALEKFLELEAGIKDGTIKKALTRKELKLLSKSKKHDPDSSGSDAKDLEMLNSISTRVIRPFFEMIPSSNPEILIGLFRSHHKFMKAYDFYNLLAKLFTYLEKQVLPSSSETSECADLIDLLKNHNEMTRDVIMTTVNQVLSEFVDRQEIIPKTLLNLIKKWFPDHQLVKIKPNIKHSKCLFCGHHLKSRFLSSSERNTMVSQLTDAYKTTPQLSEFKDWLMQDRRYDKPTFIIDGGNLGYYKKANFSYWQINFMITSLVEKYSRYFQTYYNTLELPQIILIIHNRHLEFNLENSCRKNTTTKNITFAQANEMKSKSEYYIKQWNKNALVWATPPKCYDDIFILMASFMIEKSITITNDQFNDHHTNKLDSNLFYRWRERHLASYNIESDKSQHTNVLELELPLPYSIGFQTITEDQSKSKSSGWHIPVFKLPDDLQQELDENPDTFPDPKYFPNPVKNHVELITPIDDIEWYCLSK